MCVLPALRIAQAVIQMLQPQAVVASALHNIFRLKRRSLAAVPMGEVMSRRASLHHFVKVLATLGPVIATCDIHKCNTVQSSDYCDIMCCHNRLVALPAGCLLAGLCRGPPSNTLRLPMTKAIRMSLEEKPCFRAQQHALGPTVRPEPREAQF